MERSLTCEVKGKIGERVKLAGWVHNLRIIGKLAFIVLRDRTGTVQTVAENLEEIKDLQEEAAVEIIGQVIEDERAPGGYEVDIKEIKITSSPVEPLPLSINKPGEFFKARLETVLNHRALSLRNLEIGAVFKVQAEIIYAFREFLRAQGFLEVHTPKIVASGTEGGTALFPLQYFDKTAYLAQSPQFYKQMLVGAGYERVFEVGHVYRAEEHSTTRHLNEYISLDLEMGFIESEQDVINLEMGLLQYLFAHLEKTCRKELQIYKAQVPHSEKIPQLKLAEAQKILEREFGKKLGTGDLDPEAERLLCQYAQREFGTELIFVTHYPVERRPMYTLPDPENPALTRSFDLLYKGLEITTGSQRIHQYEKLCENIKKFSLNPEDFEFYLEIFKYGMPPHGGLAIGAERLTMQLLGLANIREASFFPRDRIRLTP